jgi:hypothetical protein
MSGPAMQSIPDDRAPGFAIREDHGLDPPHPLGPAQLRRQRVEARVEGRGSRGDAADLHDTDAEWVPWRQSPSRRKGGRPVSSRTAPTATKRSNSQRLLRSVRSRRRSPPGPRSAKSRLCGRRHAAVLARRLIVDARAERARHRGQRPRPPRGHRRAHSLSATRHHPPVALPRVNRCGESGQQSAAPGPAI